MGLTVLDLAAELTELEDRAIENIQIEAQRKKCMEYREKNMIHIGHDERYHYDCHWSPRGGETRNVA